MLVPLRASNEHLLSVRVPGAQDQRGWQSTRSALDAHILLHLLILTPVAVYFFG